MNININNNSCLMLACNLYTPVGLGCIIDKSDLIGTGIEFESHVTVLYAKDKVLPKEQMLSDFVEILGEQEFNSLTTYLKNELTFGGSAEKNLFQTFELDVFENDTDFLILKLKESNEIYDKLTAVNKGLRSKYGISTDFSYTPHLTLAEVVSGAGKKYIESEQLRLILNDCSTVSLEDFILSYSNNKDDIRKTFSLTTYHTVDRYFREKNLRFENESI